MSQLRLASLVLAGAVALSACSDHVTTPAAPRASEAAEALVPADRFIFLFSSRSIPADFGARVAAAGGTIERTIPALGLASVRGLSSDAAATMGGATDVAHWSQEIQMTLDNPVGEPLAESTADALQEEPASPGDPTTAAFYARQWHLRQIGAHTAWAAGKLGSAKVRVGILDTGIDYRHPDLAGRVDLSLSRSFVPQDNAAIQAAFPGAHEIADLHYHGTHVAATVSSNAVRAAGVTSNLTLVGIKVLNRNGSGNSLNTIDAIVYSADVGLDVINMSLGIAQPLERRQLAWFNELINRAMAYAHGKGTTVVVSAGNENIDLDKLGNGFKAYCTASTVVCVSATGPVSRTAVNGPWQDIDAKAGYSNYGREYISVAAPGGNGASNVTAACSGFSLNVPVCQTGAFVVGLNGTSMAAPHVAALAGLLVEKYGRKPSQVKEALAKSSDDLGPLGQDPVYGKGRINVARALGL